MLRQQNKFGRRFKEIWYGKRSLIIYSNRKNQAVSTLGSKCYINVGVKDIEVDPQLLFQCIITVSNSTVEDTEQLFQYELRAGSSIFV